MLTPVPTTMPTKMVSERGNCKSAPIEPPERNGTKEKMVVSEVINIGNNRSLPALTIDSNKGIPLLRCRLMVSTFRIESLITIPAITISPVIDIRSIASLNRY